MRRVVLLLTVALLVSQCEHPADNIGVGMRSWCARQSNCKLDEAGSP